MRLLVLALLFASATGTYLRTQDTAAQGVLDPTPTPTTGVTPVAPAYNPDCADCDHKSMQARLDKLKNSVDGGMAAASALKSTNIMDIASKDLQQLHAAAEKFYSTSGTSAVLKQNIEKSKEEIKKMKLNIPVLQQEIKDNEKRQADAKDAEAKRLLERKRITENQIAQQKNKESEKLMKETELATAVGVVTQKNQEAEALFKKVQAKKSELTAANDALIAKSSEMLTAVTKEQGEINQFEMDIKQIQTSILTQESAIKKCNEQIGKILETKKATEAKKQAAKDDKASADGAAQAQIDDMKSQVAKLEGAAKDAERKQKEMKALEETMKKKLEELGKQPNIDKDSPEYKELEKKLKDAETKSNALAQELAKLANAAKDMKNQAAGIIKNLESGMSSAGADKSAKGALRFQQLKSRHTFMTQLYQHLDAQHKVATGALVNLGGQSWGERISSALSGSTSGGDGASDGLGCDPNHLMAVLEVVASAVSKIKFEYSEVCTLVQEGQAEVTHLSGILGTQKTEQEKLTKEQKELTDKKQAIITAMKSDDAAINALIKQESEADAAWKKRIADIDAAIQKIVEQIKAEQKKAEDIVKNKIEPLQKELVAVTQQEKKVRDDLLKKDQEMKIKINELTTEKTKLKAQKDELVEKEQLQSEELSKLLVTFNSYFGTESKEASCEKDFVDPEDCPKFSKCKKDLGCPDGMKDEMFCEQNDGQVNPRAGLCKFDGGKCDFADKIAAQKLRKLIDANAEDIINLVSKGSIMVLNINRKIIEAGDMSDVDDDISGIPIVSPDKKPPTKEDTQIEVQVQNKAQKILEDSGFAPSNNDDCAKLYSALSNKQPVGENWARATIEECGSSNCYPCFGEGEFGKDPDQCGDKCEYKMEKVTTGSAAASMTRKDENGRIRSGASLVIVSGSADWAYNFKFRHRYHVDTSSTFASELLNGYEDGNRPLKDILFKAGNFGCVKGDDVVYGRTDTCIKDDGCQDAKKTPKDPFPPAPSDKDLLDEQNGCGAKLVPIPSWREYNYNNPGRNRDVAAINGVQQVRLDYRPKEHKGTGLNCLKHGDKSIVAANSALIMTTLGLAAFQIAESTPDTDARFACKLVGRFQIGIENRWVNSYYAGLARCRATYVHNEIQKIVKFASVSDYNLKLQDKAKQKSKIEGAFKRVCHLGTRKGTTRAKVQLICGVGVCDRATAKST